MLVALNVLKGDVSAPMTCSDHLNISVRFGSYLYKKKKRGICACADARFGSYTGQPAGPAATFLARGQARGGVV